MTSKNLSIYEESSHPFVSVIMNCYNSDKYLVEALESVVAQTYHNWEIIFWDNQSTDKSAEIFKSYKDKRFCYFLALEHTTLGKARNLAVEKARGEWVAFLDCDDLWCPEKLEKQVAIIQEEDGDLGLVYGRSRGLIEERGLETAMGVSLRAYESGAQKRLPEGDIFKSLLKENFLPLVSCMVLKSAYLSFGGIDPLFKQSEDYDLFLKISSGFKARAVQEVVSSYRIHSSNISHSQEEDNYQEDIAIVSRYLPTREAKLGIRIYQTYLSAVELRRKGKRVKGLRRLLVHGDTLLFLSRSVRFIWRRLIA